LATLQPPQPQPATGDGNKFHSEPSLLDYQHHRWLTGWLIFVVYEILSGDLCQEGREGNGFDKFRIPTSSFLTKFIEIYFSDGDGMTLLIHFPVMTFAGHGDACFNLCLGTMSRRSE
jgi:hypothetical protein